MRVTAVNTSTRVTRWYQVSDAPMMTTMGYGGRDCLPFQVKVAHLDGAVGTVEVFCHLMKKDGQPSKVESVVAFYSEKEAVRDAPWLAPLLKPEGYQISVRCREMSEPCDKPAVGVTTSVVGGERVVGKLPRCQKHSDKAVRELSARNVPGAAIVSFDLARKYWAKKGWTPPEDWGL